MGVTITGASRIQKKLAKTSRQIKVSPKKLIKTVSEARNRMRDRTNKGLNASGSSFKRLNPAYAEYKKGKGKRGIPDLHFEGHMLNAMQVKGIRGGAEIYFNNETERLKAYRHHYGRGHSPKRSFFRLGSKLEKYIFDEFRKPIKKALR